MNDLDGLVAWLRSVGIEPVVVAHEGGQRITLGHSLYSEVNWTTGPKIDGYSGFHAVFEFDAEGRFREIGVYE